MESLTPRLNISCDGPHLDRRALLKWSSFGAAGWLAGVPRLLARAAENSPAKQPAQSVILLWMSGGPSQLETFDPHPGTEIAAGTEAISTAVKGVSLASGFERLAEQMQSVSLVRSMQSKEGDHGRGIYLAKTGYRPDPTVNHPSIGAICCAELPKLTTDIPRHVSILPDLWPGRGGFLGNQYDAFLTGDPENSVPDVTARVSDSRYERRLNDLSVVEQSFARGRGHLIDATMHRQNLSRARRMMTSEQLRAFEIDEEPQGVRESYGDTPFGRGCLAARRLVEVGVPCVEVTLAGWDSHIDNHDTHNKQIATLDPALAGLIADLRNRERLDRTIVVCAGEFGRTPWVNRLGGRDHWPHAFSLALAGGGIRGGQVIGETNPEGGTEVADPRTFADVHATVLAALGLDPAKENISRTQRPIKLSEGTPLGELLPG